MKSKKTEIYLRRKIDAELVQWKSREDRLPLMLKESDYVELGFTTFQSDRTMPAKY